MGRNDVYAELRRHLDGLPVGFPPGLSGRRILRLLFTETEARAALGLSWRFRTATEAGAELSRLGIDATELARQAGYGGEPSEHPPAREPGRLSRLIRSEEGWPGLAALLRSMASKGSILFRAGEGTFALMPFVVGMFELQAARLTREFVQDTRAFLHGGFGLEFLTTGEAQSRVIPIGAAVRPGHRIADYDEFRSLIRGAGGRIAVLGCVCREAADLAGRPCAFTERRELCIVFRDFADTVIREGWGRAITEAEATALADLNQREGLVMRPSNEREPQFLCACCGDCCGLLAVAKAMKRPADFVATNHRAKAAPEMCTGCGGCLRICPMAALASDGPVSRTGGRRTTRVLEGRCIGCGVCVAACRFRALSLEPLLPSRVPPRDTEELQERLAERKRGILRKLGIGILGVLGLPAHPHGRRDRVDSVTNDVMTQARKKN